MKGESRYDRFLSKLIERTKNGAVKWKVVVRDKYSSYFDNVDQVRRVFECEVSKDREVVLLIVRDIQDFSEDFDTFYERAHFEVVILRRDGVEPYRAIFELNSEYVSPGDLKDLYDLVQQKNVDAEEFFSKWE